jgi:hypothetical protein
MSSTPPDFSTGLALTPPDPEAPQAIGELWVRLSQLEAWLDVGLGYLLGLGWSATQSVVANLNARAKLDMADSLSALRIQRLGDNESRQYLKERLKEVRKVDDDRTTYAHGRHLLEDPGGMGKLVKSRADRRHVTYTALTADPSTVRAASDDIKKLTVTLMQALALLRQVCLE